LFFLKRVDDIRGCGRIGKGRDFEIICGEIVSNGEAEYALLAGVIADFAGLSWAIGSIAILTFLSGLVATLLMRESADQLGQLNSWRLKE
jgi:hypothetical protein